jgi:hypothetical protein
MTRARTVQSQRMEGVMKRQHKIGGGGGGRGQCRVSSGAYLTLMK